ncbi:hypothetical protein U737_04610 [Methylomonas sp. LW13]|uniref:hypothetical protein n=1 Tax=unclassified Methylomonas TaxID=2608980 RepID=UPI00051AB6F8|nr:MULTISPECIES: hypothetical protein [unclassified Methylomonas]PKD41761.1 hypothetical protein CWO84_03310 [Methylomonas sp. Kb3]QBC26259.1 hypothetical protein U737_04610 [Methylomonas sp. LW13]
MSLDFPDPNFLEWQQQLQGFADNIQECILKAEWEGLADILDKRQVCLEQFFAGVACLPEHKKLLVKQVAQSMLEQDSVFISYIEEQKSLSAAQQAVLDRGRKAMQAYNSY